jgi:hypothetical protein
MGVAKRLLITAYFMKSLLTKTLVGAALILLCGGCTTTYITPISTAMPELIISSPEQTIPATQKTFELKRDWQYGPWVMKKGAKIVFYSDGLGTFDATVYSQYNTTTDILHFQSIQYGSDANRLFAFPKDDVGLRLHMRAPWTDYKYTVNFGYDARYFDEIDHVKFLGRLRLQDSNVGDPTAYNATYQPHVQFEHKPTPPEQVSDAEMR